MHPAFGFCAPSASGMCSNLDLAIQYIIDGNFLHNLLRVMSLCITALRGLLFPFLYSDPCIYVNFGIYCCLVYFVVSCTFVFDCYMKVFSGIGSKETRGTIARSNLKKERNTEEARMSMSLTVSMMSPPPKTKSHWLYV